MSMDTGVERNTGGGRASSVEDCSCPTGYKGLSCEDCAPGYARSTSGLYLGTCKPCECNGKSNSCDPEFGTCLVRIDTRGPDGPINTENEIPLLAVQN